MSNTRIIGATKQVARGKTAIVKIAVFFLLCLVAWVVIAIALIAMLEDVFGSLEEPLGMLFAHAPQLAASVAVPAAVGALHRIEV